MDKSTKYYLNFLLVFGFCFVKAQPNCKEFLRNGDTLQYKACVLSGSINSQFYQFDLRFQNAYDQTLEMAPTFDYAYFEKSVAYLKSGDFINWKVLIDKAVQLNPKEHLGYRAWCRYQFFRDYEGALVDFSEYDRLWNGNVGYSVNGAYHLNIAKGICLSALGKKQEAIKVFENQIKRKDYIPGLYDYYQLGATYFQLENYDKALENFEKQSTIYNFAENIYFKAKVSKVRNKDYLDLKNLALKTYDEGKYMKDPYTHHFNKIYRTQITEL